MMTRIVTIARSWQKAKLTDGNSSQTAANLLFANIKLVWKIYSLLFCFFNQFIVPGASRSY